MIDTMNQWTRANTPLFLSLSFCLRVMPLLILLTFLAAYFCSKSCGGLSHFHSLSLWKISSDTIQQDHLSFPLACCSIICCSFFSKGFHNTQQQGTWMKKKNKLTRFGNSDQINFSIQKDHASNIMNKMNESSGPCCVESPWLKTLQKKNHLEYDWIRFHSDALL